MRGETIVIIMLPLTIPMTQLKFKLAVHLRRAGHVATGLGAAPLR